MSGRGIAIALAGVVLVAGAIAWSSWITRGPLGGSLEHDFGRVTLTGETTSMEHTFRLVNRSGATLEVDEVRPGCGCAIAEPSARRLAPGDPLEIDVTLRLNHAGRKRTHVDVLLAGHEPIPLWIEAVGERPAALFAQQRRVRLLADGPLPVIVICEVTTDRTRPPDPAVTGPDGVDVVFAGWEHIGTRPQPGFDVVRWRGTLRATWSGGDLPGDAELVVSVPGTEPARMRVFPPRP